MSNCKKQKQKNSNTFLSTRFTGETMENINSIKHPIEAWKEGKVAGILDPNLDGDTIICWEDFDESLLDNFNMCGGLFFELGDQDENDAESYHLCVTISKKGLWILVEKYTEEKDGFSETKVAELNIDETFFNRAISSDEMKHNFRPITSNMKAWARLVLMHYCNVDPANEDFAGEWWLEPVKRGHSKQGKKVA